MKAPPLPKKSLQTDKKDEKTNEPRKDRSEGRKTDRTDQQKENPKSSGAANKQAFEQAGKNRDSVSATPVGRGQPMNPLQLQTRLEVEAGASSTRSPTSQQTLTKSQQAAAERAEKLRRREEEQLKERQINAEKIEKLLKLAYLRNMKPHEAAQFLHIPERAGKSASRCPIHVTRDRELNTHWKRLLHLANLNDRQGAMV